MSARRVFVVTFIAAAATLPPALAVGTDRCEDINAQATIVGEGRYITLGGSDTCYANAYWDSGDELSLGGSAGGASTTATNLRFHVATHTLDDTNSDCSVVTYNLTHRRSNSTSGSNCPSSYTSSTSTLTVDSCQFGNSNFVIVDKTLGTDGFSYRKYWQWVLEVNTGTGCTASDSGCARVDDSTSCMLSDY